MDFENILSIYEIAFEQVNFQKFKEFYNINVGTTTCEIKLILYTLMFVSGTKNIIYWSLFYDWEMKEKLA